MAQHGCAEEGVFLGAWLVKGASPREGGFTLSCWELGLRWIKLALGGRKQELSGACRAVVGWSVMLTHPEEVCDNRWASERQPGSTVSWKRERDLMVGHPSRLASSLGWDSGVLSCSSFLDSRANSPSELVSLLSPECGLIEPHLLDDLAARMLGVFVGAGQGGGLEGERVTPLSM